MIGGKIYRNRDHRLPESNGRIWHEADFDYISGYRNNCRLLYSNDGLLFVTYDHYTTFFEIGTGGCQVKSIVLDFTGIKSLWDLHEYFKTVFRLTDQYGRNMDALWDCLYYSFEFPTTITLKNLSAIPHEMHEAVEIMLDLFRDLENEDKKVTVVVETETKTEDISDYII